MPLSKDEVDAILKTQVSDQFLRGMVARMEMSYFKYGDVKDAYPSKIDALASLQQRLEEYKKTNNTEFLIDAANFAMIEFMLPRNQKAFFQATDSDNSPGRINTLGCTSDAPNVAKHSYVRDGD